MDAAAIKTIGDLAVTAAEQNKIDALTPAIFHNGNLVSLEHLQHGRSRFRGAFTTSFLSEFVSYVKENALDHCAGFIDERKCSAKAFFNLGNFDDPGHADWTGTLTLTPSAAYAAIQSVEGKPRDQKSVAEWIEDWSPFLSAKQGDALVSIGTALAAIRNLTIKATSETTHVDKDLGRSRSALEDIEAKSQVGIPSHLVFRCAPYAGFAERDFLLRVSILTGGDKPSIITRTVAREAVEEDIAKEFKQLLLDNIGDAAKLTIGSFQP